MSPIADFPKATHLKNFFWKKGQDIRLFGILLVLAGVIDFVWIASYPHYQLKVFGATFDNWLGEMVKYQHPFIHWLIGYGFWKQRLWALYGYLVYLGLGCLSEVVTQVVGGFHTTRTTMILVSLLFGGYIVLRRPAFQTSPPAAASREIGAEVPVTDQDSPIHGHPYFSELQKRRPSQDYDAGPKG